MLVSRMEKYPFLGKEIEKHIFIIFFLIRKWILKFSLRFC